MILQFSVFLYKPGKVLLHKLEAKILSPNQILGFFNDQNLLKECIDIVEHRDIC